MARTKTNTQKDTKTRKTKKPTRNSKIILMIHNIYHIFGESDCEKTLSFLGLRA